MAGTGFLSESVPLLQHFLKHFKPMWRLVSGYVSEVFEQLNRVSACQACKDIPVKIFGASLAKNPSSCSEGQVMYF